MFCYHLGSNVALPPSIFTDDGLESHFVRVLIEGAPLASAGMQLVAVPFAFKAVKATTADTADYAHASPGGGSAGWVDDGSVVRLSTASDLVGIGESSPTENLVIGKDLGSYSGNRIVVGDDTPGAYTGLVTGEDGDNRGWLLWNIDDNFLGFGIRDGGSQYNNVLTMKRNRIGLGINNPSERLVLGKDMGSFAGELIVIGNDVAGRYSGVKFGEDADNCANMLWDNDGNYLYFTTKDNGASQGPIYFRGGKLSIGEAFPFALMTAKGSGNCAHFENSGSYGGNVILAKANNTAARGIRAWATADEGVGVLAEADGTYGTALQAEADGSHGVAISATATGSSGVGLVAWGAPTGKAAKFYGNVVLYSDEDESMVMELGEGFDYAESFDLSDPSQAPPGTVLSIDPENPGGLKVSDRAYDTRVAGIVAGANGLGSGVILGAGRFDRDVALAGRVYCNVDASDRAVQPGDLLTTSPLAGYAMKASDYDRARGAILGKAMEGLKKGDRGQILVLVTLQ
jgi:hypothetical protein